MLDRSRMREAQALGFLGDRERFRVILGGSLVGMVDGGKELHTELHLAPISRSARVESWPVVTGFRAL